MPRAPDEDLYKPNRVESKPSRFGEASADANQDNTVLEEIRNMTKVLHQGFTLPKRGLPQFDGNPKEYYQFMRRFEESVMKQVDSPSSQLEFLIEMCSGEAREAVKSFSIVNPPSLGLNQALEVLRQKYGLKHTIVKAHLDCITRGQTVKSDKQSLYRFASVLHNCAVTMKAWGFESELDSSQTLRSVSKRLPLHLQRKFNDRVNLHSEGSFTTFELVAFVKEAAARSGSFFGQILAETETTSKKKVNSRKERFSPPPVKNRRLVWWSRQLPNRACFVMKLILYGCANVAAQGNERTLEFCHET